MAFDADCLDRSWFHLINAGAHTPDWLIGTGIVAAAGLIYLVPLYLVVGWFWGRAQWRSGLLAAFAASWLGVGINRLIAVFVFEPRPFALHVGRVLLHHPPDSAFPSDHVTILSAMAVTLLLQKQRWGLAFILLAVFVGWARIFVGVHWPFDILGAFAVGMIAGLLTHASWRYLGSPVTRSSETIYRRLFALPIRWGWIRE